MIFSHLASRPQIAVRYVFHRFTPSKMSVVFPWNACASLRLFSTAEIRPESGFGEWPSWGQKPSFKQGLQPFRTGFGDEFTGLGVNKGQIRVLVQMPSFPKIAGCRGSGSEFCFSGQIGSDVIPRCDDRWQSEKSRLGFTPLLQHIHQELCRIDARGVSGRITHEGYRMRDKCNSLRVGLSQEEQILDV
jgi:hypothetical protein